jgi:glycosyltransferase involved in cell wall biosynthesis
MSRGDFFLCSSAEQRNYYLGWLTALGRVNPLTLEADPELRRLIVELPFGAPEGQPPIAAERGRVLTGVADDDPVIYFGGIYDWYDPVVLLDAVDELTAELDRLVVVFVDHPHPELTPQSAAVRARDVARERGWLGTRVRFEPWRPYRNRFDLAQVSDLAVVTHRPGLETDLSFRTRLVDLMWLGLPLVVTDGGSMAAVVREEGAGIAVPPGDPAALAAAVRALLADPDRRHLASGAARRWAASRSWPSVAAPLLEYARRPWRDPHRDRFAAEAPPASTAREPVHNRLSRVLKKIGGGR